MGENNNDTQKFRPDKKINFQVQNFKNWWNSKALPTISKIGNQRHFSAIRDSFGTMIPLIIAGSIGILINAIIFGGAGSNKISLLALFAKADNPNWDWNASTFEWPTKAWADASQIGGLAFGYINIATIGAMSLYFSFLLGYFIALSRNFKQPVMAGLASFAAFIVACMGQVAFFMSAQGLITALIVGLFTSELFIWFGNMKRLEVKLPSGVPPAVGKSFAVFLPMTFTLASVALVNICFLAPAIATTGWSVDTWQNLVISSYKGGSIWQPSFDNFTISGNDFLDWVAKGPYKDAHIDPNSLFVNGATADIINGYGNASDVAGINNYFDGVRNGMTKDGYNLFGQYLVSRFGGEIKGITSWQDSVIDIKASMGTNGIVVILAERWNQIQVPTNAFGFGAAIYKFFTSWFIGFATGDGGLGLAILYAFMISFFWFFGVHGSNIMAAIFEPIWWMILGINTALVSAGMPKTVNENSGLGIFAKPFFDVFMNIGGSGATLGLLIMTVFLSRRRELKEVAKYALPAGCFNVNEPAIFGYPLVLNPTFITPFIIAPIVGLLIGWVATGPMHIINVVYVAVPWTTPWFIAAILATTSPIAILVAIISFVVTTAIWLPFILLDNKLYYRKLKKTDPTAYEEEMKYLHDKEYRNKVKAEAKAEKDAAKAELKALREKEKAEKNKK